MINNEIRDWQGNINGYRCTNCGNAYQSGWGSICNNCRDKEKSHRELINEIKQLKQIIKNE